MLKGAPPMIVVGVSVRVAVLAIQILLYVLDTPRLGSEAQTMVFVGELVSNVMIAVGAIELAVRTRGRVRIACGIVAGAQVLGLLTTVGITVLLAGMRSRHSDDASHMLQVIIMIETWMPPALASLTVVGFGIAAGMRAFAVTTLTLVCTSLVTPFPFVAKLYVEYLESSWGVIGYCTLYLATTVLVIMLAARVARGAEPVARDHDVAARGARRIAFAAIVRAMFAAVVAGSGALGVLGDGHAIIAADCLELVALAVLVRGAWLIARGHHPALASYLTHIAFACALGTLLGLVYWAQQITTYEPAMLVEVRPPWWIDLGATLTIAWLFVIVGRYAKRAKVVRSPTVLGGVVFTAASCIGVGLHDHAVIPGVCALIASLAAIPMLRATARSIASDPIKSTADVFA